MTAFVNDTLAAQIQRGEVFYIVGGAIYQSPGTTVSFVIETGAQNCSFQMEIIYSGNMLVSFKEGVTASSPIGVPVNMNFESAATIDTRMELKSFTGGTGKFGMYFLNGKPPELSPFNKEAGCILQPNTKYGLSFLLDTPLHSSFAYSCFFRENI